MSSRAARFAMPLAGLMIAHQVAARAVRDATFLSVLPASRLPAAVAAAALLVVASVPVYSRLLERFGPRRVVASGFLISAVLHLIEWRVVADGAWAAVMVYLHIAGFSGLLLSGFWSLISERFDPRTARERYGRIAAMGTAGGLLGGLAAARIGDVFAPADTLLLLAALHVLCGAGVLAFDPGSDTGSVPTSAPPEERRSRPQPVYAAPHIRTLAYIVVLGSAGATIFDYLLKREAVAINGTGPALLQFFAQFYVVVQVATFLAQFGVNAFVQRFGLGRAVSSLPAGVAGLGLINLMYPAFSPLVVARGTEYVVRGSLFRSAYELVFVPMAPAEKRRAKTFLDVTCDRAGDVFGAGLVQMAILAGAMYVRSELLTAVLAMSVASLWLGRRLDALYLQIVERRLASHGDDAPVAVQSETGWTVLDLPAAERAATPVATPDARPSVIERDPVVARAADLRSGDRERVAKALGAIATPEPIEVAAVVQLLAWNDFVPAVRNVLARAVEAHAGQLGDALLDPDTDFAIRRRLPRVLSTVDSRRVLDALVAGLDDARFEVRYQCSAGIRRILARHAGLSVDRDRILAVVERELATPLSVWQGHRLIDGGDDDEDAPEGSTSADEQHNVQHVFSLLTAVLPAEPLRVAFQGIQTDDPALRGVAVEYLEGALPRSIWRELTRLLGERATPSSSDVRERSGPPPPATPR